MFAAVYLLAFSLAALPLGFTLLRPRRGGDPAALLHRIYRDLGYVAAVGLSIIALETAFRISLQNYWFSELGQQYRYWLALGLGTAIFAVVCLVVGLFAGANLHALCRPLPIVPRSAPWIGGFVFSAIVGLIATEWWTSLLAFLGATQAGVVDPVFGRDVSFYLLALPFYDGVLGFVTTVLVLTLIAWAMIGLSCYPWATRVWRGSEPTIEPDRAPDFMLPARLLPDIALPFPFARLVWDGWLRQGAVLAMLFCLSAAAGRFLARYHLVISGHSNVVAGASFADIHVSLPAYAAIIVTWLAAACVFASVAILPRLRAWFVAVPARWRAAGGIFAAIYLVALITPSVVEHLYVGPNQITLERPYLTRSIAGTRDAYNLDGASMEEREFAVAAAPLSRADLDANSATLQDARIWDWRALEPQLQQIQGLRPYYTFAGVDIDRYTIDGIERQVMITARELDVEKLPDAAKVWVNLALKYTHGYGAVAVPVNEMDSRGNPVLWAHNIPLNAKGDLAVTHGAIYYGSLTRDRVYVRTTEKEFDFPQGQANAETVYDGKGGITLSNFWRRLVVAREVDGLRLFISGYFRPDSRVLLRRNIIERVERLAPFLTLDRDPYIVADGDHYSYIVDAYATSANYPYSEAYQGSLLSFQGRNYLRNSVKAVIDAYNGSVTFYIFDHRDPIVAAYWRMLPGLFKDRSEMPANLQRHIRYPEDLFTVQAEMYGTYHMTNPTTFYNREDRWEVPHELYHDREIEMPPYYVITQLPHSAHPEFLLMLPLSVAGKNQLAGWLAGLSDGDNYGKMVAFRFPKGIFIDGPAQIESRINSDSRFSGDLTLWDQHGSRVIRGNLIVLPLNSNQLVAIEPVYIEAEQTRMPTLARVVFAQLLPDDRKIEWASTLRQAEDLVARTTTGQANVSTKSGSDRLAAARAVFLEMQEQYAIGNFAHYGELLQQLGQILQEP